MKHLYSLLYLLIWIPVLSFGQSFKGKVYDVTQYGAVSDTTILSTPQIRDFPHEVLQTEEKCAFD